MKPGPAECPTCGDPIRLTHTCKGARSPKLRPAPSDWREQIARARDAEHAPDAEQEQLPLENGDLTE